LAVKTVYQTLEDRGTDFNNLETQGPYLCNWANSWLGTGYYFWDTFIENAHWWGQSRNYRDGYIICKAICDFNDNECFDLVGNTEHLKELGEVYDFLKNKGFANEKTTVAKIIHYLKNEIKIFKFSAIRADGRRSKNFNSDFSKTLQFEKNNSAYLDLKPPIQICFFSKISLNLRDYKIIYPPEYSEDYLA